MNKNEQRKNRDIANAIDQWGRKNSLLIDSRIYFNGKAYDYNSDGNKNVIEDILAEDYLEYADNDLVCMSFEGPLYAVLNENWCNSVYGELDMELTTILDGFGMYYELGNGWNLTIYPV